MQRPGDDETIEWSRRKGQLMTNATVTVADLGQQVSDAVASRNTDALRQLSHPDLVHDVVGDRQHQGRKASRGLMDTLFRATPDMTYVIDPDAPHR